MAYWLERRTIQKRGKGSQIIWKRYAACGSPELLERVRMGQKHPGCIWPLNKFPKEPHRRNMGYAFLIMAVIICVMTAVLWIAPALSGTVRRYRKRCRGRPTHSLPKYTITA